MRYFTLIVALLILHSSLGAQQRYVVEWSRIFSGDATGTATGVAIDKNGNIYVAGYIDSSYVYNFITIKYDHSGNMIWADTVDNGSYDKANDIVIDDSGYIYVTGASSIGGNYDYLTIKYDSMGNIVWADTVDNGDYDQAYAIAIDSSGNIYVTGSSSISGDREIFTVKYDNAGNIIRKDTFIHTQEDIPQDITVDRDGNLYITGYSGSYGNHDFLTIKYDSSGHVVWMNTVDNGGDDIAHGIAVDKKGNVYIIGRSSIGGSGLSDYLLIKYDSTSTLVFADTLDNGGEDEGYSVVCEPNGEIFTAGFTDINNSALILVTIYDSTGSIEFRDTIRGSLAFNMAIDKQKNIYIVGGTDEANMKGITIKYSENHDAELMLIISGDTANSNSFYTPGVWAKNNSYDDTLNFWVAAYVDSGGVHLYEDSAHVTLIAGDGTAVYFEPWRAISTSTPLLLRFSILTQDLNHQNDTISKTLYVMDLTHPVIDSAIAYDGTNAQEGIDDDDYVILYFSEPTNKPALDNTNIDNVLSLSNGHSWLDGFGGTGHCEWNPDGTQLFIDLTTAISPPTVTVGDLITPDSLTIQDGAGNPCFSPVVLGGSFDPSGIDGTETSEGLSLTVSTINGGQIVFSYNIPKGNDYTINLLAIDGRVVKTIHGKTSGYHKKAINNLKAGIYFLNLKQGRKELTKRIVIGE